MNIIRKLLAGAAVLGMALAGAAAVTGTASAGTVPVVYGRPAHIRGRLPLSLATSTSVKVLLRSSVT